MTHAFSAERKINYEGEDKDIESGRRSGEVVRLFPEQPMLSPFAQEIMDLLERNRFQISKGLEEQFPGQSEANKHMGIIVRAALESEARGTFNGSTEVETAARQDRIRKMLTRYFKILQETASRD